MLHLKYLPPGIAQDIISCYFENQGDDVEVLSFEEIGANEAIASVAGLTNEGKYNKCHACADKMSWDKTSCT